MCKSVIVIDVQGSQDICIAESIHLYVLIFYNIYHYHKF